MKANSAGISRWLTPATAREARSCSCSSFLEALSWALSRANRSASRFRARMALICHKKNTSRFLNSMYIHLIFTIYIHLHSLLFVQNIFIWFTLYLLDSFDLKKIHSNYTTYTQITQHSVYTIYIFNVYSFIYFFKYSAFAQITPHSFDLHCINSH